MGSTSCGQGNSLLWLGNEKNGIYTIKLGYFVFTAEEFLGDRKWWWKYIWSMHASPKLNILSCLSMENIFLTLENGLKRGWIDYGICALCMNNEELTLHIFVLCSF